MGEPGQPLPPCPHCRAAHPEEILICPNTNKVLSLEGRLLDNRFRFISQLGEGGMSTVWMAENHRVRKRVAIKLLHPEFARNARTLDRFQNEATAAGRIGNPHICDILDLGESPLGPYIVMEMLTGQSFGELLDSQGRIEASLAVLIICEALKGLIAAHAAGIIHRDLKPENVFLHEPEPGRMLVKLMDFGISKFTDNPGGGRTGANVIMGTPEYMSPEQAAGAANVDARTDVWAMGVMLYAALAGQEPFRGNTMAALLLALSTDAHVPLTTCAPGTDPQLSAIVDRCLAKEPEQRFGSAQEMFDALAPFQQIVAAGERPVAPVRTGRTMAFVGQPAPAGPLASGPMQFRPTANPQTKPGTSTTPSVSPSELVESSAVSATGPGQAATWSSELGSPPPEAGQSWSMGHSETFASSEEGSEYRRERERRRGGGWVWLIVILLLGLAGGGAWAWSQGMLDPLLAGISQSTDTGEGAETDAAEAGEAGETSGPTDEPPPADLGSGDTGTGDAGETSGGTTGSAEDTETSAAPTDTGADSGADDPSGGEASGDEGGDDSGASGGSGGSGDSGDSGGTPVDDKPKPPAMSKLVLVGGLYTHKSPGPNGTHDTARSYCRGLKRKNRHNLGKWRMATVSEISKFRGTEVKNLLYWSSEKSGDSAKTVKLFNGESSERSTSDPSPSAFCVSRR